MVVLDLAQCGWCSVMSHFSHMEAGVAEVSPIGTSLCMDAAANWFQGHKAGVLELDSTKRVDF